MDLGARGAEGSALAEKAVSAEETSRESGGIDERLLVSVSDESS